MSASSDDYFHNFQKNRATGSGSFVSSVAPSGAALHLMKHIIISVLCLSVFTLSAIAEQSPAADNTGKNERDRSGETQTSGDQSNSSQDTQTTAAIRRAVVKDKSLSATAKNVKIITANGTVTLRGPVKNDAEKTKIAELAQSAAGSAKIDNQLEVKASKSTKE